MASDMEGRMKLVARAARSIADAIKSQKIGSMKKKSELSSQENTETSEDGAYGIDLPEESFTGQNLEGTLDHLANPQASTDDITHELSEAVDKSGEQGPGEEGGRFLDPQDKGFSYIGVSRDRLRAPSGNSVTQAAIGQDVPKNNKKKK